MAIKLLLAFLFLVTPSLGYYSFRTRIPNGEIVPHPCKANYRWGGVGHTNPDGGGERNIFGKHFDESNYEWNDWLCRMDSDGDGLTNGQELGDPMCTWKPGTVPSRVTNISHPGICEPFGKGDCVGKDMYVDCEVESFKDTCDVIENADVKSQDFLFKEVEVPNTETNYYCQYFDLPTDGDYHIIADEGVIDNHDVVHHMLLYACPQDYKGSPTDDTPSPCDMNGEGDSCSTLVSLWTVGLSGNCFGDNLGFRIGANGYKKVKLEIHYNNPMLIKGMTDHSGMRIYYQPDKPGVQDMATLAIGQTRIEIPPGMDSVEVRGSCSGDCTRGIVTKPMHIVSAVNHMHYMGRSQRTEVIRDGQVIKVLADDERYDYDSPVMHKLEEPFEVLPGDELATTCTYSSMSKKRWVYYGDATSDEMCFAFLMLYPFDALPHTKWCTSHGPLDICEMYGRIPKYGCDWNRFTNLSNPEMQQHYINVVSNCRLDGICTPECKEIVEEIKEHPCQSKEMSGLVNEYLQSYPEGMEFVAKIHSCTWRDDDDHYDHDSHDKDHDSHDSHDMDSHDMDSHDSHDMDSHDSHDMDSHDKDSHDMDSHDSHDKDSHDMDSHDSHDKDSHGSHDMDSHDKDNWYMSDSECRRQCGHVCTYGPHDGDDDWQSNMAAGNNVFAILMTSFMAAMLALLL